MNEVMTNEESNELAVFDGSDLGAGDDLESSDLGISRILIANGLSAVVSEGKAVPGQIYSSKTGAILHERDGKPVEMIIVAIKKYWVHKENDKFVSISQNASSRDEHPWEDGKKQNIFVHAFYGFLASDLEDGFPMPVELGLSSTNLKQAEVISHYILKMKGKKLPSYAYCFDVSTAERVKDNKKWFGFDIKLGRQVTKKEAAAAKEIRSFLSGHDFSKVKASDYQDGSSSVGRTGRPVDPMEEDIF